MRLYIFRIIAMSLIVYLCCPLFAEEDLTEAEMDSLAMRFFSCEKGNTKQQDQQFYDFDTSRAIESYTQNHEYTISQDESHQTYIDKILIIVKENVYSALPTYILRYAHDIHNAYGCAVDIVSVNGERAVYVKSLIQSYSNNLDGVVLIGGINYANYYHPDFIAGGDTLWKAETFPCDLFYMDLDGGWHLQLGRTYDQHTDSLGDVEPEIFVGRINTGSMGRNETQELIYFFDRDHQYWTGQKALNKQKAVSFTGKGWDDSWQEFRSGISPLYGSSNYDAIYGNNLFTTANYRTYLQNNNYEFLQLACHSDSRRHNFQTTPDSMLYAYNIDSLNTQQIGYNLFCCHACDWTYIAYNTCLGESYLYGLNNNSSALALVGSTKTGGMLGLNKFYTPMGNGKCIGQALKEWWIEKWGNNHDNYAVHWAYGMVLLGDPLINFNFTNDCDNILYMNSGEEDTNNMYYAQSQIVVQNYSLTQGQSVTLSAPTIQITGPFTCGLGSSFIANPFDNCICNTSRESISDTSGKTRAHQKNVSNLIYSIYPNPVSDILIIDANIPLTSISIYNQSGQCVLHTTETHINVSNLSAGLYLIRAITKEEVIIQSKIIHK